METVWVYFWKAAMNYNYDNPSNYTYLQINFETTNDKDVMDELCLDWAENVDFNGDMYGFEYDWEIKNPPKEWLEQQVSNLLRKIGELRSEIHIFESEIENFNNALQNE